MGIFDAEKGNNNGTRESIYVGVNELTRTGKRMEFVIPPEEEVNKDPREADGGTIMCETRLYQPRALVVHISDRERPPPPYVRETYQKEAADTIGTIAGT